MSRAKNYIQNGHFNFMAQRQIIYEFSLKMFRALKDETLKLLWFIPQNNDILDIEKKMSFFNYVAKNLKWALNLHF